jgi:hypothetical protein
MAILTLEIDDDVLARAEEATQQLGSDVKTELVAKVEELSARRPSRQLEAVRRLIARADAFPTYLTGGMPDRDERNAR